MQEEILKRLHAPKLGPCACFHGFRSDSMLLAMPQDQKAALGPRAQSLCA
jgi:hypothetical protein